MSDQQEDTLMLRLFRKFKSLCPKEQDYELHAMEVICRIWQSLFHKFESGDLLADPSLKNISHMTRMHKMLDFIHENYSKPMTVEQIADAGHISKRECFRCFRAVINQSPIEYLIQYRLTMAANLLMSSDKPLSAISESCGFENISYFTKCFKKRYGILPREFRSWFSFVRQNLIVFFITFVVNLLDYICYNRKINWFFYLFLIVNLIFLMFFHLCVKYVKFLIIYWQFMCTVLYCFMNRETDTFSL